jgi:hypothetical protein
MGTLCNSLLFIGSAFILLVHAIKAYKWHSYCNSSAVPTFIDPILLTYKLF